MSMARLTEILEEASCLTHGMIGVGDFQERLACEGKLFYYAEIKIVTDPYVFHMKTGAKAVVMLAEAQTSAANVITLREGVSVSNDGTALVLRNYNRTQTDDDMLFKIYHTPTIAEAGILIKTNQAGFGTNPGTAQAGAGGRFRPYTLKPNTSYTYTFTGAATVVFGMEVFEDGAA